ncbi:Na+/H+ antiporter [Skermania sp. ID1734]|uniref:Na+/H+ antiporter n=1 Tax=Skermania sp. ID1734 TaxID=2597516 RepID=UPI00117F5363|nr:Na+/H+ antiporter [Skermania sp. ID1734]TSD98135.1 Na+/H+ antiporter [Skermania sp. ID1734]
MLGLELVVTLGLAVLAGNLIGHRFRVAPPILLLAIGVLLWFIVPLRSVHLPPQAVLLLFLPPLLYWGSFTTPLRGIRRDLRGILATSTVLVIVTAAAVAGAAHLLGLPWGPAWVLGAAVAPTDATAVTALARMLPNRDVTLLRAESLVNDGTALVVYGVAVGITVGNEHFSLPHIGWLFVVAYLGGSASGALVAWLVVRVRRRLDDPFLINVAIILTPFAAFLLAEEIGASGVLAAVVAGLIMSQAAPRMGRADARRQTDDFWSLSTFLLNASLFVLVGLESQSAVRNLTSISIPRAVVAVGVVVLVLVAVRMAFLFGSAYALGHIDRRLNPEAAHLSNRSRVVIGVAGFRGAVSLAAALAIPETLATGDPFPDRDTIIFITAGVIAVTVVAQGLLLPAVVRWAQLPRDNTLKQERRLAETLATKTVLAELPKVAAELGVEKEVAERLEREYTEQLLTLSAPDDDPAIRHDQQYAKLRLAMLSRKRAIAIKLRDERRIDDTVLRQIQATLDIEEVRLAQRQRTE